MACDYCKRSFVPHCPFCGTNQVAPTPDAPVEHALSTLLALTPSQRAQVLAELPETKPTAWQRLQEWLTEKQEGPGRCWDWDVGATESGSLYCVYLRDLGGTRRVAKGEGPTLDDALANALEKLK